MPPSIDDIRKELKTLPAKQVLDLTLRLARFKKENKELLSYLLFDSENEQGYIESLQIEMDESFAEIKKGPAAPIKKQLRKMIRMMNRQIKYIGTKSSAVELMMHFCKGILAHEHDLLSINSVATMYQQQLKKISRLLPLLDEDLQHDYSRKLKLEAMKVPVKNNSRWWRIPRRKS